MNIRCDRCGLALLKMGALLFGPPDNGFSKKQHLCCDCYLIIRGEIELKRNQLDELANVQNAELFLLDGTNLGKVKDNLVVAVIITG